MKKLWIFGLFGLSVLAACSSPDPILPGVRTAVFPAQKIIITNSAVMNLPTDLPKKSIAACPFTRDASNTIWSGDKKIFSGFPTPNSVRDSAAPVCDNKFVYAGLSTGELVKVNPKNRKIEWIADIYRDSNLTGGASVLDVIVPPVIDSGFVYAGGLGDAFCKLNAASGKKIWCAEISVGVPFIVLNDTAFVLDTENKIYAINTKTGTAYWSADTKKQVAPKYENKKIIVANEKFDAPSGEIIK